MKRFKNILFVAADIPGAEGTLDMAVALAARDGARLSVAGMLGQRPLDLQVLPKLDQDDIWELAAQEKAQDIERLIAPFHNRNLEIHTELLTGTAFLEIIRKILKNEHDLVVMAADGNGETHSPLFGSLSMHLMRKSPCPVWVLKPTRRLSCARILAAVDPAPHGYHPNGLDVAIMELASSLAQLEDSELHVVHAWTVFAERIFKNRSRLSPEEITSVIRAVEQDHRERVQALLREFSSKPSKCQIHLVKGDAGTAIPQIARNVRADVMVLGTVSRTDVSGFLMGGTAESILGQVHCSVLTVKPDGFVSPVQIHGD